MTRVTFIEKEGLPKRKYPFYMMLRDKPSYNEGIFGWYKNGICIKIPIEEFDVSTIFFYLWRPMPNL
jgi:hypothetical protein